MNRSQALAFRLVMRRLPWLSWFQCRCLTGTSAHTRPLRLRRHLQNC
jgi:hypothetical protein